MDEWNRMGTYLWRKVERNKAEISGTTVHGKYECSVSNYAYFYDPDWDGYAMEDDLFSERIENCFGTWTALWAEEIVLHDGIETIGKYAFYGCDYLKRIFIPESVKEIIPSALYGCKEVTIYTPAGSYAEKYARENNIPVVLV